jgi:hypothetical protein
MEIAANFGRFIGPGKMLLSHEERGKLEGSEVCPQLEVVYRETSTLSGLSDAKLTNYPIPVVIFQAFCLRQFPHVYNLIGEHCRSKGNRYAAFTGRLRKTGMTRFCLEVPTLLNLGTEQ